MKKLSLPLGSAILVFAVFVQIPAQERIGPSEAARYIGKKATVCGEVASANYAAGSRGGPTFLNLDRPYPSHIFTAVIWGENRDQFPSPPERVNAGKRICVTGTVGSYQGVPQIVVRNPSQISGEK